MHMADALVAPAVAGTMFACSAAAAVYSVKQVKLDIDTKKVPVMGVMGAFVFAAQMINFTIPGTGSSGHLCGGMMLSALLGPWGGFLTMIGVLLQVRIRVMMVMPSISGSPRSKRIRSGHWDAAWERPSFPLRAEIT